MSEADGMVLVLRFRFPSAKGLVKGGGYSKIGAKMLVGG